jgi:hypothetical protein
MSWQTRYVLLLWLSLVVMLPFDMAVFDSTGRRGGLLADLLALAQVALRVASQRIFCINFQYSIIRWDSTRQTRRRTARRCSRRGSSCAPTPLPPSSRRLSTPPSPACNPPVRAAVRSLVNDTALTNFSVSASDGSPVRDSIEKGGVLKALAMVYKPGRGAREHLAVHGGVFFFCY